MIEETYQRAVLADLVWKEASWWRSVALIVSGALLVALCSRIVIPLQPVPITGQTFGVLLAGALLGSRRGMLSILTYLCLGFIGIPVFASAPIGLAGVTGPTAGYLAGFVAAAGIVGWLCECGWDRRTSTTFLAMTLGMLPIYTLGVVWLTQFVGWRSVVPAGITPFLLGDALKIVLAALVLPRAWGLVGGRNAKAEG